MSTSLYEVDGKIKCDNCRIVDVEIVVGGIDHGKWSCCQQMITWWANRVEDCYKVQLVRALHDKSRGEYCLAAFFLENCI